MKRPSPSLLLAVLTLVVGAGSVVPSTASAVEGYFATRYQLGSTFNGRGGGSMLLERNYGTRTSPDWKVDRTWGEAEWTAWERESQAIVDCETIPSGCASAIKTGATSVSAASDKLANAADSVITKAREAGSGLSSKITAAFEDAGLKGGGLTGLGAEALGGIVLTPLAWKAGVDIGNGLDQLFGLPKFGAKESEEELEEEAPACSLNHHAEAWEVNYGEGGEKRTMPAGYYVQCFGAATNQVLEGTTTQTGEEAANFEKRQEAGTSHNPEPAPEVIRVKEFDRNPGFGCEEKCHERGTLVFDYYSPTCAPANKEALEKWLGEFYNGEGEEESPSGTGDACPPVGIPAPGLLDTAQENVNEEHEVERHPEAEVVAGPMVDTIPPTAPTGDSVAERLGRDPATREYIEKEGEATPEEIAETEIPEIVIPEPEAHETGEHYKERLESIGFTDVEVTDRPEVEIDPKHGPDEVVQVDPAPGTKRKGSEKVKVSENPADSAPAEPGGGIGPPTLPGIHLPKLGLLCTTMPFGVPCWLVHQLEAFSGTGSAPVWHIASIEIAGYHTPEANISLAPLEPAMVIIRPFMVIFGTIGIVLLFYRIFTGHAIGRGENPPNEVPDPAPEEN